MPKPKKDLMTMILERRAQMSPDPEGILTDETEAPDVPLDEDDQGPDAEMLSEDGFGSPNSEEPVEEETAGLSDEGFTAELSGRGQGGSLLQRVLAMIAGKKRG